MCLGECDCCHRASLTLAINQTVLDAPGLVVTNWTSNGTDVVAALGDYFVTKPWRLLPSIPDAGRGKVAFRMVTSKDAPTPAGVLAGPNLFSGPGYIGADWISVDVQTYGGVSLELFVFDVDQKGNATAVSPVAFQATYKKTKAVV